MLIHAHRRKARRAPVTPWILLGAFLACLCMASPADANLRDARRELTRVRIQIKKELRSRPEMQQAKQDWIDARLEYRDVKRLVVDALLNDSDYLARRARLWQLEDELEALREEYRNGVPPAATVIRLSQDILAVSIEMSAIEEAAFVRNKEVVDAKEAYLAASRRLLELRNAISEQVRQDPRFRAAYRQVNPNMMTP